MKLSKLFFALFFPVLLLMSCSTNVKSDSDTESKITGEWETVDIEDGFSLTERIKYNPDNTWESTVSVLLDSMAKPLCSFTASGTWRASAKQLIEETDIKSIKYTYEPDIEILCELPALVNEFIKDSKEPWLVDIVSFGKNEDGRQTITFLDDDENVTYVRAGSR